LTAASTEAAGAKAAVAKAAVAKETPLDDDRYPVP
jgi:hypothetical protein